MTLPTTSDPNTKTKYPCSYRNSSNNQENLNVKVKKKRIRQKSVNLTSEQRVEKNRQKNQIRCLNETPEQREFRLKRQREYRESRTPEQKEASRLKNALYTRRYRQEQLDLAQTLEEKEALLQKRKEYSKNYREKLKSLAKTPEEKEALRLKLVIEKRRSIAKLRKLPDRDCKGRLCTPEEIEARKLKRINNDENKSLLTLKKRWQATEKMREYRQKIRTMKMIGQSTAPAYGQITKKKMNKQIASIFPIAVEEIKIEKEVLQETTIYTFPSLKNSNSMQHESVKGTSWSWYEPSCERLVTHGRSKSHLDYRPSFIDQDNFPSTKSHSTKVERRKTRLVESLSCMRELIDATTKGDRFAIFGKYIALKLDTSKKDEAEVNIAKLLIDSILQNLAIGLYSSDIHCGS